ncbi:antileukoproteinase-like [Rana temporaria]|uniref:antileukoproteinase-like n=1 Tax=Rana temporaria TaxID=8407 RepID=UPI001AAE01DD|nr:antileukoproteinase-like [Rana temporaria]
MLLFLSAGKSGQCPHVGPPNTVIRFKCLSVNKTICKEDKDCEGRQKCCSELCVNKCRDPVPVVKPGNCPPMNILCLRLPDNTSYPNYCTKDADCDGEKKCCNRCGMRCLDPR